MGGESAQATAERTNGQQTDSAAYWEQSGVSQSATASVLRELEFDGWTVLHDVRMPGRRRANVDHVVIGNGQVYVIDTEVWAGSVTVAGGVLRQNGRARQKRVTGVAEMAKSIASLAPMLPPSTVHPVLCFVREDWVSERFGDVLVCSTENLVSTLRNEQEQVRGPAYLHNDLIRQLEDALKSQSAAAEPVPAKPAEPKADKARQGEATEAGPDQALVQGRQGHDVRRRARARHRVAALLQARRGRLDHRPGGRERHQLPLAGVGPAAERHHQAEEAGQERQEQGQQEQGPGQAGADAAVGVSCGWGLDTLAALATRPPRVAGTFGGSRHVASQPARPDEGLL